VTDNSKVTCYCTTELIAAVKSFNDTGPWPNPKTMSNVKQPKGIKLAAVFRRSRNLSTFLFGTKKCRNN
jgi:hypothetical protein